MKYHTGAVDACQPPVLVAPPTNPSASSFLQQACRSGGYTALPTAAYRYYTRLGLSEAEFVLIGQLCSYWYGARDPFPGLATLAQHMGKSTRTVQGYLRHLEASGLLAVHSQFSAQGRQQTNSYDLRPFFEAIEALDRQESDADIPSCTTDHACEIPSLPASPTPHAAATSVRDTVPLEGARGERSCGGRVQDVAPQVSKIEEEIYDLDKDPPLPPLGNQATLEHEPPAADQERDVLSSSLAALSAELGDLQPQSSLSRALNLLHAREQTLSAFEALLAEAAARTRAYQPQIYLCGPQGQRLGMPYFFRVLERLLWPAQVGRVTSAERPHTAQSRRARNGRERPRRTMDPAQSPLFQAPLNAGLSESPALAVADEPAATTLWGQVCAELRRVLTPENYEQWLGPTWELGQEQGVLHIGVRSAFGQHWLEHKLAGRIRQALDHRGGTALQVAYVLEAAPDECRAQEATTQVQACEHSQRAGFGQHRGGLAHLT